MTATFAQAQDEDRRLVILRTLYGQPDYRAGAPVLRSALHAVGHVVSNTVLHSLLDWLVERQLVTRKQSLLFDDLVSVVSLTEFGADVALGFHPHTGVKRPPAGSVPPRPDSTPGAS